MPRRSLTVAIAALLDDSFVSVNDNGTWKGVMYSDAGTPA